MAARALKEIMTNKYKIGYDRQRVIHWTTIMMTEKEGSRGEHTNGARNTINVVDD